MAKLAGEVPYLLAAGVWVRLSRKLPHKRTQEWWSPQPGRSPRSRVWSRRPVSRRRSRSWQMLPGRLRAGRDPDGRAVQEGRRTRQHRWTWDEGRKPEFLTEPIRFWGRGPEVWKMLVDTSVLRAGRSDGYRSRLHCGPESQGVGGVLRPRHGCARVPQVGGACRWRLPCHLLQPPLRVRAEAREGVHPRPRPLRARVAPLLLYGGGRGCGGTRRAGALGGRSRGQRASLLSRVRARLLRDVLYRPGRPQAGGDELSGGEAEADV